MSKEDQPAIKSTSTDPVQPRENGSSRQATTLPTQPVTESETTVQKKTSITTTMTPAAVALVSAADSNSKAGNLESAVATIERALRIEPRNPLLIYKLAELRLEQEKPRLAEDLAKKSVLLSAQDTKLKKRGWLLIAAAREMQGNVHGAKQAKQKSAEY